MFIRFIGLNRDELSTVWNADFLRTVQSEARHLEKINYNKTMAANITAAFIRTCYILPRLLEDEENPAISQEELKSRISEFYSCATLESNEVPPSFSKNPLNELVHLAVPWLFDRHNPSHLKDNFPELIPFIKESPSEAVQIPTRALNSAVPLEKTLRDVLDDLPTFIYTFIEKDLVTIEEQIQLAEQQISSPFWPFFITDLSEKLIKVSFATLLFIQYAPCFVPPPQGTLSLTNYDLFRNKHNTALDMISTVGRALLYDANPPAELVPRRQSRSYIVPCLTISMKSLRTTPRISNFIETVFHSVGNMDLNPLNSSSFFPPEPDR